MKRVFKSTQVLTLSLFMILLCFFIVLNSLSDFKEARVIPILASLEASFSSKMINTNIAPSLSGEKKPISLFSGGAINELEVAFRNSFDVSYAKVNTAGTILQVEINRKNLIDILQKANTVGFYAFHQKLLKFMNGNSQPYRMNIIFGEENPLDASMRDQKTIPDLFIKTGLTRTHFKVSTRKGDPEVITLVFIPLSASLINVEGVE